VSRGDTSVFAGFSTEPLDLEGEGAAVAMDLGGTPVTAYAAAAEFRAGELVRLVIVDGQ